MIIVLALHSKRHLRLPELRYFQALCLLTAAWSVLQAADLSQTVLGEKVLLMKLKFTVAPFISVAIFGLLASHSGHPSLLTRRNVALISLIPAASVFLVCTAELHTLFIYDLRIAAVGPSILQWSTGPLYWAYIAYSYGIILAGIVLLVRSTREANPIYRRQAAVLILALLPPFGFDMLANMDLLSEGMEDLALAAFAMSAVIMTWGLTRYPILDVRPIARSEVIDNMTDAMLVIDNEGRLIDINRSAEPLLIISPAKAIGIPVSATFRSGADIAALLRSTTSRGEIVVGSGNERRTFDASVMPIEVRGEMKARMVLMRDITERKRADEALKSTHGRLDLLSSMTRHDLLNRLAVIDGYAALAIKEKNPEKIKKYLEKMVWSSEAARSLVEFTGDYESVGINAPSWLRVDEIFVRAAGQLPLERIEVSSNVSGVQVYADAMLEKVLYNLIDNTLCHGVSVSKISLDFEERSDRLALIYRDDGVGVPGKEKPLIFLRGFGANTGLGLFLAREVLAITGIEIVENGEPGEGARFEMTIPAGEFRVEPRTEHAADVQRRTVAAFPRTEPLTASRPPSCPTTR